MAQSKEESPTTNRTSKARQQRVAQGDQPLRARRRLLGGATGVALVVWHKPMINSVLTPAHAQTSMPLPAGDVCPMVMTANVVFGPVSGTTTPPVCSVTFDVLSADPAQDLTVQNIETSPLAANVTVDVQDLGTTTSTTGPRIVWRGPASDAPFCSDLMPTDDVTFTVTATCAAATLGDSFTQTFTLASLLTP